MILEQTASDNGGLCAPCAKNDNPKLFQRDRSRPPTELSDRQKRQQLEGAIMDGDLPRINELLTGGSEFIERAPSQFHTWLGEAISYGCGLDILARLADAGCDVNSRAKSPDQTCPLEVAVNQDRIDAIEWLLAKGANPNLGRPIIGAINFRKTPEAQLAMLKLLLDSGADVNQSFELYGNEDERFTVLDWAVLYEASSGVIEFLKDNGAKRLTALG